MNYSRSNYGINYEKLRYHSLHHAINDIRIPQIRLLLKIHPELVNIKTESGLTPLMMTCFLPEQDGRDKIIKLLINSPLIDPYIKDNANRSVIFYIIYHCNVVVLRYFIKVTKFNYFNELDINGYSLLHIAVIRNNLDVMEELINIFKQNQMDINTFIDLENQSPLLLACKFGKFKMAYLLIKLESKPLSIRDNGYFRNCLDWVNYHRNETKVKDASVNRDVNLRFNNFMETRDQTLPEIITNRSNQVLNEMKLKTRSHSCYPRLSQRSGWESVRMSRETTMSSIIQVKRDFSSSLVTEINRLTDNECGDMVRHYLIHGTLKQINRKRVSIYVQSIHDNDDGNENNNNNMSNNFRKQSMISNDSNWSFYAHSPQMSSGVIAHRLLNCLATEIQVQTNAQRYSDKLEKS